MKKVYLFMLAIFAFGATFAQNNVTVQVDLGSATPGSGVYVAGDFNSWNATANSMTQVGSSTIYSATISLPNGNHQFKFINGTSWENVPGECNVGGNYGAQGGNGNRWVTVWQDTTLPAIELGQCAPIGMNSVMFMVDMSTQPSIDDTVSVAGNFQGWSPGATIMGDPAGDSVYRAMAYVSSGDTLQFKYINGADWNDNENVPSACAVGGNRQLIIGGNTAAGPVCFNACASCFIPDTFDVTIQIDASNICDTVTFIDLAGPFNGWPGTVGDSMTFNSSTGYWETTIRAAAPELEFKARYWTATSGPNWEGVANTFIQFNNDTVVDPRCYNVATYGACVPKPAPADITFRVDFAQSGITPASDIYLIADFLGWQGGAIKMDPMVSNPGVYETTIIDLCPPSIAFKFVNGDVNTTSNEEGLAGSDLQNCGVDNGNGGYNRTYVRPDGNDRSVQFIFDSCAALVIGVDEDFLTEEVRISPNPFSASATVELGNDNYNVTIIDITGRIVRQMNGVTGNVIVERGNMKAGIYMMTVVNEKGNARTTKFIVE